MQIEEISRRVKRLIYQERVPMGHIAREFRVDPRVIQHAMEGRLSERSIEHLGRMFEALDDGRLIPQWVPDTQPLPQGYLDRKEVRAIKYEYLKNTGYRKARLYLNDRWTYQRWRKKLERIRIRHRAKRIRSGTAPVEGAGNR